LEGSSLDAIESSDDEVVVGEFDDDEIQDDLPRINRDRESADVIDVKIEIVNSDGYTDEIMRPDQGLHQTRRSVAQRAAQPRHWVSGVEWTGRVRTHERRTP
jgi:hypothetical protein